MQAVKTALSARMRTALTEPMCFSIYAIIHRFWGSSCVVPAIPARCVKDMNLKRRLCLHTAFKRIGTYRYVIVARNFVKVRQHLILIANGLTPCQFTFVEINVFTKQGIGNDQEHHDSSEKTYNQFNWGWLAK